MLAFGNRARLDLIPGLAENALPLKTIGDAMHIRNTVLRRVAQIELETDPAVRRRLGRFVVIGGGFSGVETAGELADCLRSIRRYYPRVAADELQVTLLQDQPRLLLELPERLGHAAHRSLCARGVDVRIGTRATGVSERAVALAGGETISTATVICTIGTRPNALVDRMTLPVERGRIVVDPDLSVRGTPGVWAIGDCASIVNARDGKLAPPTAQFAVREARHAAANLLATLDGTPTRAFDYKARGSMAAIGHMKGVAELFGIPLSGLPAWLLWRAYYLSQMPTLGTQGAHLRRVDVGDVLSDRHHASALHARARSVDPVASRKQMIARSDYFAGDVATDFGEIRPESFTVRLIPRHPDKRSHCCPPSKEKVMFTSNRSRARAAQSALLAGLLSLAVAAPALAGGCPADKVGNNPLTGAAKAPVGVTEMELAYIDLSKESVNLPSAACATVTWRSSPAVSFRCIRTPTGRR